MGYAMLSLPAVVVAMSTLPALAQVLDRPEESALSPETRAAVVSILENSDSFAPVICAQDHADSHAIHELTRRLRPNDSRYILNDRWTSTALEGGGLNQGDPTVITYSFVPDGTDLDGTSGSSNMRAFLDSVVGPGLWQSLVQQALDGWSDSTGITFVLEPNDDGVPQSAGNPGVAGVRGDIRIGGTFQDGNGGVLAYNYFPNHGDMVIDTGDSSIYGNAANNYRAFRNIFAHEVGHGIALSHIESSSDNFLMEPFLATSFDGPQIDDIRGGQRGYGDMDEHNDSYAGATDLVGASRGGAIGPGDSLTLTGRSIDDGTDADYFVFSTTGSASASLTLTPQGGVYQQGSQGGSQSSFDANARIDLNLAVADSSQSVIASADATGLGESESLTVDLTGAGPHYVIVDGNDGSTQLYELQLDLTGGAGPCSNADLAEPFGTLDFSDVVAFLSAFGAMDPAADLASPFGVFDFSDVVAYLGAFGAGCP